MFPNLIQTKQGLSPFLQNSSESSFKRSKKNWKKMLWEEDLWKTFKSEYDKKGCMAKIWLNRSGSKWTSWFTICQVISYPFPKNIQELLQPNIFNGSQLQGKTLLTSRLPKTHLKVLVPSQNWPPLPFLTLFLTELP